MATTVMRGVVIASGALVLFACNGGRRAGDAPLPDASLHDAGLHDAAMLDSSSSDMSIADTSIADTSVADAGHDAGAPDAGPPDSGPPDAGARDAGPASPGVYFSEYVEGTSNNKAVEIFNGTAAAFDLSACIVRVYANGSATSTSSAMLTAAGTLATGGVFVVCNPSATFAATCDLTAAGISFNGNDAVELACGGTTLDVLGQIGFDPGTEWGSGLTSTADNTLRRHCGSSPDSNGADAFDPAVEWDGFATDDTSDLGMYLCP